MNLVIRSVKLRRKRGGGNLVGPARLDKRAWRRLNFRWRASRLYFPRTTTFTLLIPHTIQEQQAAMGGDLNLKKSWHPHLRKNVRIAQL